MSVLIRFRNGVESVDLVTRCRAGLLPILKEWEGRLRTEYASVSVNVYDFPASPVLDGHCVGIDCVLKEARLDAVDQVALCIDIHHMHATPTIQADVVWGHPSGRIEAELFDGPVAATVKRTEEVVSRVPELIAALQGALRRGFPDQEAPRTGT